MTDEVVQIIEPAGGILPRPVVQLGLHPPYRDRRPVGIWPGHGAGIHRRVFGHCIPSLTNALPPFPMCRALPGSEYYDGSAPLASFGRHRAYPATRPWPGRPRGRTRAVPTFTAIRSADEAPGFTPAASPRLRRSPSPWPSSSGFEDPARSSPPPEDGRCAPRPSPYPPGLSGYPLRGVTQPVPCVYLSALLTTPGPSGGPEPTQLCRGCSHPPRRSPAQAASSFVRPLRRPDDGGLSPPPGTDSASWRTRTRTRSAPRSGHQTAAGAPSCSQPEMRSQSPPAACPPPGHFAPAPGSLD